ncbi:hypothetical protein IX330_000712 [Bacteroides pyogenes]|nr:hypothetical protein [Bacteroides pyogenes]MBR8792056.1 hypothetical protein [Bacteroides pyogenes]
MATEPLHSYLKNKDDIKFVVSSSACWRGYIGEWAIDDEKLYLVNLNAYVEGYKKIGLDYLFPNEERVFAKWFSGEIRIPHGEMLEYVHQGYASLFENELFLIFENGVLIGEKHKNNRDLYNNMDEKAKDKWKTKAVIEAIFGVSINDNPKPKKSFWRRFFGK